jgi:hypothetical protein
VCDSCLSGYGLCMVVVIAQNSTPMDLCHGLTLSPRLLYIFPSSLSKRILKKLLMSTYAGFHSENHRLLRLSSLQTMNSLKNHKKKKIMCFQKDFLIGLVYQCTFLVHNGIQFPQPIREEIKSPLRDKERSSLLVQYYPASI